MKAFTMMVALAATAGCAAGYPKPTDRLVASEGALRGAQEIGAQAEPNAALYVKLAEEEVGRAKVMMQNNDNREADFMLRRARADAELAIAISRAARAQAELQQLEKMEPRSAPNAPQPGGGTP